jgi:hypothetical protein
MRTLRGERRTNTLLQRGKQMTRRLAVSPQIPRDVRRSRTAPEGWPCGGASSSANLPAPPLDAKPQSVGESIAPMGKRHSHLDPTSEQHRYRNHAEAAVRTACLRPATRSTATASCPGFDPRTSAATTGPPTPLSVERDELARTAGQALPHRQARPHAGPEDARDMQELAGGRAAHDPRHRGHRICPGRPRR